MASDSDIALAMDRHLRAKGFTCGRTYSNVGDVVDGIAAQVPDESRTALKAKILRIGQERTWEFKVRGEAVSASRASDKDCGN